MNMVPLVQQVLRETRARKVSKAQRVPQALLAHRVSKEYRENRGRLVQLARLDLLALRVQQVNPASKVKLVRRGLSAKRDRLVPLGRRETTVKLLLLSRLCLVTTLKSWILMV